MTQLGTSRGQSTRPACPQAALAARAGADAQPNRDLHVMLREVAADREASSRELGALTSRDGPRRRGRSRRHEGRRLGRCEAGSVRHTRLEPGEPRVEDPPAVRARRGHRSRWDGRSVDRARRATRASGLRSSGCASKRRATGSRGSCARRGSSDSIIQRSCQSTSSGTMVAVSRSS